MADKYCPECGTNHGGAKFCPECGTMISDEVTPESNADSDDSQDTPVDVEESSDDGGLNITLGKIVGYIVGPLLILSALGGFIGGSVVGGLLLLLAGLISLPIFRSKLKKKQGISLSRWATVIIVIVLLLAGGAMLGTSGDGTGAIDDGDQSQTIEKPATDIVIQLNQLGSGWSEVSFEGNETSAVGEYYNVGEETYLDTSVDKYETTDDASDEYEARVSEVQERYGTDSASVGHEAIVYSISDASFVIVRYSNIVIEVTYQKEFSFDPDGEAVSFAEDVVQNADR